MPRLVPVTQASTSRPRLVPVPDPLSGLSAQERRQARTESASESSNRQSFATVRYEPEKFREAFGFELPQTPLVSSITPSGTGGLYASRVDEQSPFEVFIDTQQGFRRALPGEVLSYAEAANQPVVSAEGAAGRQFLRDLPSTTAAYIAANQAAQATQGLRASPLAPIRFTGAALPLIAGAGAAFATATGQQKGAEALADRSELARAYLESQQQDITQQPNAAFVGGLAAQLPTAGFGFNPGQSMAQRAVSSALGGTVAGGLQGAQEIINPQQEGAAGRIALAAIGGAAMQRDTSLGKRLGGMPLPKIEAAPSTAAGDAAQAASQIKQQGGANAQSTLTELSMGSPNAGLMEIPPAAIEPSPVDNFIAGRTVREMEAEQPGVASMRRLNEEAADATPRGKAGTLRDLLSAEEEAAMRAERAAAPETPVQTPLERKLDDIEERIEYANEQLAAREITQGEHAAILADLQQPNSRAISEPTTASLTPEQVAPTKEVPQVQAEPSRVDRRQLIRQRAAERGMVTARPASSLSEPISPAIENSPLVENAGLEATPQIRPLSIKERNRLSFLERKFTRTALSEAEDAERAALRTRTRALGEYGRVSPGVVVNIAAPAVGAAVGATQGETTEDRISNAAIGASLASGAALASTALASRLGRPTLVPVESGRVSVPKDQVPPQPQRVPSPNQPERVRSAFQSQVDRGTITPELQQRMQDTEAYSYTPLPNNITTADARAAIAKDGLQRSIARVADQNSDLTPVQRVEMSRQLIEAQQENVASLQRELGDSAPQVNEAIAQLDNMERQFIEAGTKYGQAIQAYSIVNEKAPAIVFIRKYQKILNEARDEAARSGVPEKDLPNINADVVGEIRKRVKDMQDTPQGFRKREKLNELYTYIIKQSPKNEFGEVMQAVLYANILSGPQTQLVNFSSTGINGLANYLALSIANPSQAPGYSAAYARGLKRGLTDAQAALKGSTAIRGRSASAEPIGILERGLTGPASILNHWKWVGRVMSASDQFFYAGAEELGRRAMAYERARVEGLGGKAMDKRVAELMGQDDALFARAKAQAKTEQLTGNDLRRRVYELVDEQRGMGASEQARQFALRATYNNKPEGVAGALANAIEGFTGKYPMAKFVVPFVRIPANVLNTYIDYTPFALPRLIQNRAKHPEVLRKADIVKMVGGTAAASYLLWEHAMEQEKENPAWELTGGGTGNFRNDRQLVAAGWRPYSLRVGDRFYSYKETPFAMVLSWIGNLHEAKKYRGMDERSRIARASFALQNMGKVWFESSFLKGVTDFADWISSGNVSKKDPLPGLAAKVASYAVPNLLNQTAQIFDPILYDDTTIQGALTARIPVVRGEVGRPTLNVFGKPVGADTPMSERVFRRFMSTVKDDPVYQIVASTGSFVPTPTIDQLKLFDGDKPREATPDEYYEYMRIRGNFIYDAIKSNAETMRGWTPQQRARFIERIANRAGKVARSEIE
jgi:hypothetical protein